MSTRTHHPRIGAAHRMTALCPLLVLLVPFMAGVGLTAAQSLGWLLPIQYLPEQGALGLSAPDVRDAWAGWRQLAQPHMAGALLLGLRVAGVSALLSVAGGALLAYGVWRLPARMQLAALVFRVPLVLPHIVVAFLAIVFWSRSGLVSAALHQAGIIGGQAQFPALLWGGDGLGMVLAYTYKELPFVMLLAVASLRRLDPRLIETARMLGAGRWAVLRDVVVPHLVPVLHASFLILFLYAFGAVEIPLLLGESTPAMPGVAAYDLYFLRSLEDRPAAAALLTLLLLCCAGFVTAYVRLVAGLRGRERQL
ncbi:ABC transporter permease subunit [Nitratidesulfovibrio liaohensis]|uniref:ABC transporter permease subunit n=1 Tax=Nitratidesulfovibrio liaohensis TaxID=2604158 RepID=UPI001423908F|nr:ABC transporter permease subunit [Nitratidesulfovibrio liaohensis]NHZ45504.1 ABC transporter permease subunit [Nitratidesulfovibrio liaohensis]